MVKRTHLIILASFLLMACHNNVSKDDAPCSQLTDYRIIAEYPCGQIGEIQDAMVYHNHLIVNTLGSASGKYFLLIDLESGNIVNSWGNKGRGPGEFINVGRQISIRDSTLFFSDNGAKKLVSLNMDEMLRERTGVMSSNEYPYTRDFRPAKFLAMKDVVICLGAIDKLRFGMLDRYQNRIIGHNNLYMPHSEDVDGIYVGSVYQSLMQSNPRDEFFVISLLASDFFEIFKLEGQQAQRVFVSGDATMPKMLFKPKMGTNYTIDYENSIAGNVGLAASVDRIFFLYSDASYAKYSEKGESDHIKCYSWTGEHLEDYTLPFPVSRIVSTENGLICFEEKEDKIVLCEFSFPACPHLVATPIMKSSGTSPK